MDTKQTKATTVTLATSIIIGSLALSTLAVTGCGDLSASQVAALTTQAATEPVDGLAIAARLVANHNETFLVAPQA